MMRAADVVDGVVVNVIMVEELPPPPGWKDLGLYQGELIECDDEVGIGATYDAEAGTFTPAPVPEPDPVPPPEGEIFFKEGEAE